MNHGHVTGRKRERPGNDWWRAEYLKAIEQVEREYAAKAQAPSKACPSAVLATLPGAERLDTSSRSARHEQ